jgi:DNA repair protein RecO (recombination protein O)
MIIHTKAIVLKTVDYSESSKIATLFTKQHGKIGVMGRGVKKPKSKMTGVLETGNLLDVVYYMKESRSLQILSQASYHQKLLNLRLDFEKMAVMMSTLELVSQLLHENEKNLPIFEFTRQFLNWLNETQIKPARIFPYVQIRLADLMGIGLQLIPQDENSSSMFLNVDSGSVSAVRASSPYYPLTEQQYHYIALALKTRNSKVFSINFQNGELKELVKYLDNYLKYHVAGLKSRKTDAVFGKIFNTES